MNIQKFWDEYFGNNDGKFTVEDIPQKAVLIVAVVVDLVMLFAEYRVYSVGYSLTKSVMLALGFVVVSSLPFYLGQVAFLYNRANNKQQIISVAMVGMGLLVSAYYGFSDYIVQTNSVLSIANGVSIPLNVDALYIVAVVCTVALIIGGLLFVYFDDEIANTLKSNRIQGKAKVVQKEIEIKRKLLAQLTDLRRDEEALRTQYPDDYELLQAQFRDPSKKLGRGS